MPSSRKEAGNKISFRTSYPEFSHSHWNGPAPLPTWGPCSYSHGLQGPKYLGFPELGVETAFWFNKDFFFSLFLLSPQIAFLFPKPYKASSDQVSMMSDAKMANVFIKCSIGLTILCDCIFLKINGGICFSFSPLFFFFKQMLCFMAAQSCCFTVPINAGTPAL